MGTAERLVIHPPRQFTVWSSPILSMRFNSFEASSSFSYAGARQTGKPLGQPTMAAASTSHTATPSLFHAQVLKKLTFAHANNLKPNIVPKSCNAIKSNFSGSHQLLFSQRHHRSRLLVLDDNLVGELEEHGQDVEDEDVWGKGPNEERKLYVGNLPYSTTSSQLEEIFKAAGQVVSSEVIYDRVTDRSRGFAFVTMGSLEEAEAAIKMFNGSEVLGRNVKVNFPEVPKGGEREVMGSRMRSAYKGFVDSPYKIYAGNLGWRLTSEGLRNAFAEQRGVMGAKVIYERGTGRSRGFGFVSFESAEDAEAALTSMEGVEVEGRPLRLNLAADNTRSSASQE